MLRKLILLLPLLLFIVAADLAAQQSAKSKSKDRFREKDDRRYPVSVLNADEINAAGSDFAPTYFKDGIVFISSRAKNGPRDPRTDETYAESYYAFFNYNGEPSFPQKYPFAREKRSDYHDGPLCVTRDEKTAFLTLPNNKDGVLKAGKSGKVTLKIYETHYGRPDWSKAIELPFNSDDYSCMHPSLSPDENKLFFCSDMPGGHGGFDLYVVTRSGSGWGSPMNLGPTINTDKNEYFPFMSYSGALFFSSNGRSNSLGGFDNYFVTNPLNNPEEVVNLGEAFNTSANDLSFIIDAEGKNGFFTSDRERGMGKNDIYRFMAPKGLEGIGKPEINPAQIIVTDAKTGKPLQKAEIRILQPTDDGFISGNKDFYSIDLSPVPDKANALNLQLVLKGAEDLGKVDLYSNAEGKAQTEFTRYRNYLVVVSLPGYTPKQRLIPVDSEDELRLSFALTEAPVCHKASGMVAATTFGTRILNAVVKFVHRESGQTVTVRTDWNGSYSACLPFEGDYVVYVERAGFKSDNYRINGLRQGGDTPYQETRLEPLTPDASVEATMPLATGMQDGNTIILDKIYYEYNKTTLNASAVRYLDALVELLRRYPEMEIDLISHTETRGEAALNQELTAARAENAKQYLVYKLETEFKMSGAAKRINAYGKGESEPRNRCADGVECSDEEHQQNNRIEVKIRKVGRTARP
jgi:outer membrane protein OmpA-like peptidoglycan-associated protein